MEESTGKEECVHIYLNEKIHMWTNIPPLLSPLSFPLSANGISFGEKQMQRTFTELSIIKEQHSRAMTEE
jgi:hypothetical protein